VGNVSDILIAGLGGAASGYFKGQIKENDEQKVIEETKRRETLLAEKEKRQAQAAEYQALRERGWKTEDAKVKRGEELADQDFKAVTEATKTASERQFKSGETDREIASREKIAGMGLEESRNKTSRSEEKDNTSYKRTAISELRKGYLDAKKNDPMLDKPFDAWAKENQPELYSVAFSGEMPVQEEKADPFDTIVNKFRKPGPNQGVNPGEQQGTVIQPKPLPGTMKSH